MLGVPWKTETSHHCGSERTSGVHARASAENGESVYGEGTLDIPPSSDSDQHTSVQKRALVRCQPTDR